MQYWDDVLFPDVLATIRGERYLQMSDKQIADELIALAKRAISTFMFPRVALDYAYTEDQTNTIYPLRYYFTEEIGDDEIAILVA